MCLCTVYLKRLEKTCILVYMKICVLSLSYAQSKWGWWRDMLVICDRIIPIHSHNTHNPYVTAANMVHVSSDQSVVSVNLESL